jgi:hypothetical protein
MVAAVTQNKTTAARRTRPGLPAVRIGLAAGITGMLCCVGPTVLALIGVVSAGTAFVWATDLYHGYGWWFRGGGLLLLVGLAVWSLRRRNQCSLGGVRKTWPRLVLTVGVAVATYALLYAVTTSLGTFA